MSLIPGKRYEWPKSNIPADGKVNGLFTGYYDKNNGNALFMTIMEILGVFLRKIALL